MKIDRCDLCGADIDATGGKFPAGRFTNISGLTMDYILTLHCGGRTDASTCHHCRYAFNEVLRPVFEARRLLNYNESGKK